MRTVVEASFNSIRLSVSILSFLPLTLSAQNITPISGFHASSESDPFASKGVLEVTSTQSPIAGLNGATVGVAISCFKSGVAERSIGYDRFATLTGTSYSAAMKAAKAQTLGFGISVSGVNLDIEAHDVVGLAGPITERSVKVKMRFDDEDTILSDQPASDAHHINFAYYDMEHANHARHLLLGVSASGRSLNLQVNLTDARVKDVIQQCLATEKMRQNAEAQEDVRQQEAEKQRAKERENIGQLRNQTVTVRASDTPTAQPVTPSSDTQSRKPTYRVEPTYPPLAKAAHIGGVVEFDAVIGPNGKVQHLTLLHGHPLLVTAAQEAIKQWKYDPPTANGSPTSVRTKISILFDPSK
jgi:TonB family protein